MRSIGTLALTASLLVSATALSFAAPKKVVAKKAGKVMIECPFMHNKVEKSKAIKVTAANGKSMYVCCKGCEEPAKKQLMAKK